jgi:predicted dinucleotide-binding enzyme
LGNDAQAVRETAAWASVIILAVPFSAVGAVVPELGAAADGKPLIDATNALTPDYQLALGFTTSGAEELQKKLPGARVVKAFNTVFAKHMDTGRVNNQQLTVFAAGDDAQARAQVLQLARDIGFDGVDAGPLKNARWLEALAYPPTLGSFAENWLLPSVSNVSAKMSRGPGGVQHPTDEDEANLGIHPKHGPDRLEVGHPVDRVRL